MQTVTLSLPDNIYRRLQHASKIAGKPIHELAARSIESDLPPLMDVIPSRYHEDMRAMERVSDDDLWAIACTSVDEKSQRRYRRLLNKNKKEDLTEDDRKALSELRELADHVMLRKAYAFLLLKWRGHRLPSLAEVS